MHPSTPYQSRFRRTLLPALMLCLLVAQFARLEHVHPENLPDTGQQCHVCSHLDRAGNAPLPSAAWVIEFRAAPDFPPVSVSAPAFITRYLDAPPRAPPVFNA